MSTTDKPDAASFLEQFSTPSHPNGDPTLMVVEIVRLRDQLAEAQERIVGLQGLDRQNEAIIAERDRRIAELEVSLVAIGDIAVADGDDATVGKVDAVVKEPTRYKDRLRALFTAAADRDRLASEVADLQRQLQEAREDTERLDWLANNHTEFAEELYRIGWESLTDAQWAKLKLFLRRIRAAIDAARAKENQS